MVTLLTARQRQILSLAAFPNKQIARKLSISEGQVKRHLTNLYNRFLGHGNNRRAGGSNRVMLILRTLWLGLVSLDQLAQFKTDREWKAERLGG